MVKYCLKGTDQEVKVGNKITIKVPTKTPYGEGVCEVETLVTQVSLTQLCKDGIVERRKIPEPSMERLTPAMLNFTEYKPFIRKLARRMDTSFEGALAFLDILHDASPYAHNCLLVELMAEVMHEDKSFNSIVFTLNLGNEGCRAFVQRESNGNMIDTPKFVSARDAERALHLIMPFIEFHGNK